MAGAVRTSIDPNAGLPAGRTLDERLIVRWPGGYAAVSRVLLRLPPRSRLRKELLKRTTLSAWGAWAREDLDLTLARYAPDFQLEPPREFVAAGIESSYTGDAGVRKWAADMHDAWERMDIRPLAIVDAGNPVVTLGEARLRSRTGIEFAYKIGSVFWTEGGLIVRERDFASWDEALQVAGIPAALATQPG